MAKEMQCAGWAVWHPEKGFAKPLKVHSDMDESVLDRECENILDPDHKWKVVPVLISRVDHT